MFFLTVIDEYFAFKNKKKYVNIIYLYNHYISSLYNSQQIIILLTDSILAAILIRQRNVCLF